MKLRHPETLSPAEQAAEWLSVLEHAGPDEQAAFATWLKESPRHIEEMLYASAVAKVLDELDTEGWPDDAADATAPSNVVELDVPRVAGETVPLHSLKQPWIARITAGMAALAVGTWAAFWIASWDRYSTTVGEQRAIELDDGSVAQLNIRSRLEVRFTAAAREVRLVDGEAMFKVTNDPTRPFLVYAEQVVIRALGTEFNVYRRAQDTTVSVLEGMVEISGNRFAAGEQASIAAGKVTRTQSPDVDRAAAWRQRRLIFDLDTLGDIAEEFNRYNRSPRILVESEPARAKLFSGVFDADDPSSFIGLLHDYQDLRVVQRDEAYIVRPVAR